MQRYNEFLEKAYIILLWTSNAFFILITLGIINKPDIYAFLYEVLIDRELKFLGFYEVWGLGTLVADIFLFDSDNLFYYVVRFVAISCIFLLMITIAYFLMYTRQYNF